jgi:uncharacterized repeat protein (TIGR03803 family)
MKNCLVSVALICFMALASAHGQTFTLLYNFGSDEGDPQNLNPPGIMAQGRDGTIYTTAPSVGVNSYGAVFKMSPGKLTVLHSLARSEGDSPASGLTLGTDGNFYGTTTLLGPAAWGTLFKTSAEGNFTVLYSFSGGNDGGVPNIPPIQGVDGNYYGTTSVWGQFQCGTIYKLTPSGVFSTLYEFDGPHGCAPLSPLIQATDGNFYGTTVSGGTGDGGVVFKITPSGTLTTVYNFSDIEVGGPSSLIQGTDGNLYGATSGGGIFSDGIIYKMTLAGKLTILNSFLCAGSTSYAPGLVEATDGNFYGASGSSCDGYGSIYRLTPEGVFTTLYTFDFTTGAVPLGVLLQHTNGVLYGATHSGGSTGAGVFYSLDISASPFVTLLPYAARAGKIVQVLGQGFTSAASVSFDGTPARFKVISNTCLRVQVPSGAKSGLVTVTTGSGKLTSNKKFIVIRE